jgi:signal transduction histidine kinase
VLLAKTLRSSTFRLALASIGVFGAAVFTLFGYVYWSTTAYVLSRSDRVVAAEDAVLQKANDSMGRDALISTIEQHIADQRLEGEAYLLADPAFAPVAGNLKVWPSALKGVDGWKSFTAAEIKPDSLERPPLLRAKFETLPDGYHLLVGTDISDLDRFENKIETALIWSILFIFVLAGTASVSVTRRTVGRIETINSTSRAIMERDLSKRIPLRGSHDEWDQLAQNLNLMLDRIEALMGEVKQVTDNVAHDLRTPLSRIRGRLEKAYNRKRDDDNDQLLIGDTLADLDGVLRMFTSLTRISQIEATDRTAGFRPVDLSEIASEVVELFDAAVEERGGHLNVVGDQRVVVAGDRDLLFDAVANIVDNAIKHGSKTGQVTVAVTQNCGSAIVSVTDNGPGIPADQMQNVFKRFYRLERSRGTSGNGLGLSLVAAIVRLHGARVEMEDNAPGLKFRICFPLPAGSDFKNGVYQGSGNAKPHNC